MFTVEKVQVSKSAADYNQTARAECSAIMDKIYNENPSYWPYGLNIEAHDGGVYMIREASSHKPVGFTGWQERDVDGKKIGYYSVGVLPEYRNNGYAKQAVAKLIQIKAANVDEVQALISARNKPSLALADSLHISVIKCANAALRNEILAMLGAGTAAAGFMDAQTYGRHKTWDEYKNTPFDTSRVVNGIANLGFGAFAGAKGHSLLERAGILSAIPMKDVAIAAIPAVPSITESLKNISARPDAPNFIDSLSPGQKALGAGVGALGLLGGGYLGLKAVNALRNLAQAQAQSSGGRIRVALPTKDPTDQETTLDMPMSDLEVSHTQRGKLQRDLRRRIRKENKERTVQRTLHNVLTTPKQASTAVGKVKTQDINNLLNLIYD